MLIAVRRRAFSFQHRKAFLSKLCYFSIFWRLGAVPLIAHGCAVFFMGLTRKLSFGLLKALLLLGNQVFFKPPRLCKLRTDAGSGIIHAFIQLRRVRTPCQQLSTQTHETFSRRQFDLRCSSDHASVLVNLNGLMGKNAEAKCLSINPVCGFVGDDFLKAIIHFEI